MKYPQKALVGRIFYFYLALLFELEFTTVFGFFTVGFTSKMITRIQTKETLYPWYTDPALNRDRSDFISGEFKFDSTTKLLIYCNGKVAIAHGGDDGSSLIPLSLDHSEIQQLENESGLKLADETEMMFIGRRDGSSFWCAHAEGILGERIGATIKEQNNETKFYLLREVGDLLEREDAAILATANGLVGKETRISNLLRNLSSNPF